MVCEKGGWVGGGRAEVREGKEAHAVLGKEKTREMLADWQA